MADIGAAERETGGSRLPAGRIRISSSASYVFHVLAPILPDFLALYPDITLDIIQSDALTDLVADRTEIAIRAGPLADSTLVARPLGHTALIVAAAPAWIERHGMSVSVEQLATHDRLSFAYPRAAEEWLKPARTESDGVRVSDGEGIRQLALAGVAPARLAHFTICNDLTTDDWCNCCQVCSRPLWKPFMPSISDGRKRYHSACACFSITLAGTAL